MRGWICGCVGVVIGGVSGCCAPPDDGLLAAGTWGGSPEPNALTVYDDGTGALELGCEGGVAAAPVTVAAGAVHATFTFDPDTWGPDTPEDEPAFTVALDGTVCGQRLDGTATSDDARFGDPVPLVLVLDGPVGDPADCAE
ncbi:MAG: hypothetical protein H6733_03460 [Alphaproteobacteria bacterium]|nr:hypothetical protein [Alphaproteobacteria bacterium]